VNEQKRVDGILTLSRSLGDNYLQPHVTFRPDVDFVELVPEDQFLIIACDGIWDVLSNEEAVALVSAVSDPCKAAAILVDHAYNLGSGDNCSAVVYFFNANQGPLTSRKSGPSSSPETEEPEKQVGDVSNSGNNLVGILPTIALSGSNVVGLPEKEEIDTDRKGSSLVLGKRTRTPDSKDKGKIPEEKQ